MGRMILFLILTASSCIGYARNPLDTTLYRSNGRQKAIVAVMPVVDHSGEVNMPWNLSRELTDEIRKRVYDSPKLYLLRESGSMEAAEFFNTPDLGALTKNSFNQLGAAEFVVVTELLEQKETPYGVRTAEKNHESGALLSLAMRVRVIDLRKDEPKVILQEILHYDHNVARAYMNCNYEKSSWGTESFERTPIGMAHSKLVRDAIARIEGYIEAVR